MSTVLTVEDLLVLDYRSILEGACPLCHTALGAVGGCASCGAVWSAVGRAGELAVHGCEVIVATYGDTGAPAILHVTVDQQSAEDRPTNIGWFDAVSCDRGGRHTWVP